MFRIFLLCLLAASRLVAQTKVGLATHFDGLGKPYGGCGVPQEQLETQHFVALNVFDTPGNGTNYTRPVTGADLAVLGEFQNGKNCGRWLKVTILENCSGMNDGALGQAFCRGTNSAWITDRFVGATLDMIVADACADPNGWCRDSKFHLDLMKNSLSQFSKNGTLTTDLAASANWNNRKVQWEYIEAPNYSGDIKIHFMQGAERYWTPILITHLKNGIHDVEQLVGSKWVKAERYVDMGQAFILPNNDQPLRIRIRDANDELINQGRHYIFNYPSNCGQKCANPSTEVSYQTFDNVTSFESNDVGSELFIHQKEQTIIWKGIPTSKSELKLLDVVGREIISAEIRQTDGQMELGGQVIAGIYKAVIFHHNQIIAKTSLLIP